MEHVLSVCELVSCVVRVPVRLIGWQEAGRAKLLRRGMRRWSPLIVCGSEEIVSFVTSPYHGTGVEVTRCVPKVGTKSLGLACTVKAREGRVRGVNVDIDC